MSYTQKKRRASHTRCTRRSLVELTAAASRDVDDWLTLAAQATVPNPVAGPGSQNAASLPKKELLDFNATGMMVKITTDHQNRAPENMTSSLNAAFDHAKGLVETPVRGESAKGIGGYRLESNSLTVLNEAVAEFCADPAELIVQREPADSGGQLQLQYMRRLTDEAVRLLDDLQSGKLENQANFILSECFREAATAFSMINQQLERDGYAASIDPSIFIWLANITEPETRDTGTIRLEIVPNHRGRPSTYARQVAQFIWQLVEGQGCRRQTAYWAALTKFTIGASFAETAYAFWEPIFKRAGPHVKMLIRISDPEK
ncbi:hypothetical protein [Bradyrhizobium sp. DOA1]|uniref:hypothetical protein n=1 Tax=Bradyrhizobium sp. DOA1 TaxID=1126616 RepID=UPI00077C5775|nr:hypothetical protein [Bradyrhizobium sp. DOA1]KYG97523.1 hypothetical protein SE91_02155 [Bradyrhizobium sp. DOA1]